MGALQLCPQYEHREERAQERYIEFVRDAVGDVAELGSTVEALVRYWKQGTPKTDREAAAESERDAHCCLK